MTESPGTARKNNAPVAMLNGAQPVANGMTDKSGRNRHEHHQRCDAEQRHVGLRRRDVLLENQLDRIGECLEQAEGTGLLRPQAHLYARRHLPLGPYADERADRDDEPGHEPHQHAVEQCRHRSTSPNTGSSEPSTTTRSASVWPTASFGSSARLQKAGERTFMRYGLGEPSETR